MKFEILALILISTLASAQNTGRDSLTTKQVINILSQKNWQQNVEVDIDSISKLKIQPIRVKLTPNLILKKNLLSEIVVEKAKDVPMTPYNLTRMNTNKKFFFWGKNNFLFNQSSFSHWNAGGNNNVGAIGRINYNLSYKNVNSYLENILQLGYGIVITEGEAVRKTDDYISFTINYGYGVEKNFYLSVGAQVITQFTPGFNYKITPKPHYSDRISKFMAPGYINAGMGVAYNPNENFQVTFRPINARFTLILDPHLQKAGLYGLEKDGQILRKELGAMMNISYKLNIYKNISYTNQLGLFSNYISHPERVDINYEGMLNLKFNKFINTVVNINLLYDHDQVKRLQLKQTLGVGISYDFGINDKKLAPETNGLKPFIAK
ncbi:DUF3078 domain-containing protein [Riemerella columbipharyngis]|nr:DUF3078 domain-containing protein [Riemerella columbipharyngis]